MGTLREVNGEFCVDIATTNMRVEVKRGVSDILVSEGIHHASRSLRA